MQVQLCAKLNVRKGHKADIPEHVYLCLLSGVKQKSLGRFFLFISLPEQFSYLDLLYMI